MLQLTKGAKEYERFHLQTGPPVPHVKNIFGIMKRVTWSNLFLEDGTPGYFTSWWIIGNAIHWYKGTVKCDATRTHMYWNGQLDDGRFPTYLPDLKAYVMTTTSKEKFSVRFFVDPGVPEWTNMGGS
jgi:hypothetical protein